jgi:hypothetical protein
MPNHHNASFAEVVATLRDVDLCPACGKTRVVLNVASRGFTPERVTAATHCACPGGPAYAVVDSTVGPTIQRPAEEVTTVEVCEHCGESREHAEFYNATECYTEGEWIQGRFVPGPSRGAHVFVRLTLEDVRRAAS